MLGFALLLGACAALPPRGPVEASQALPDDGRSTLARISAASDFIKDTFGDEFQHIFGQQKLKEMRSFYTEVTTLEYDWYLRQV